MSCSSSPSSSADNSVHRRQDETSKQAAQTAALTAPTMYISSECRSTFEILPLNVIGNIARFLFTFNILACVSVSKSFQKIWSPQLFRDLDFTGVDHLELFELEIVRDRFKLNSKIPRSFKTTRALEHCRLLNDVKCSNFRYLELRYPCERSTKAKVILDEVRELLCANTGLRHFSLHGGVDWTTSDLFSACSSLSCLEIDFMGADLLAPSSWFRGPLTANARLPGLTQLTIAGFIGSGCSVLALLRESPKMEALTVRRQDAWVPFDVPQAELDGLLKNLAYLTLEATEIGGLGLREMLTLNRDVKGVAISAQRVQTLSPLMERGAGIQTLTLDGVRGQHSSGLQSFLEDAVGLRELCALPTVLLEDKHISLMSDDVFDGQGTMQVLTLNPSSPIKFWGCGETLTRLEIVMECTFTTHNGAMSMESRTEHEVMYGQLGRLASLQHLRLGQERASGFQEDCLLFSLESGLRLLGRMREMRTLDVEYTRHAIGKRELEWMDDHWPRFQEVPGLLHLGQGVSRISKDRASEALFGWQCHDRTTTDRSNDYEDAYSLATQFH